MMVNRNAPRRHPPATCAVYPRRIRAAQGKPAEASCAPYREGGLRLARLRPRWSLAPGGANWLQARERPGETPRFVRCDNYLNFATSPA